MTLDAAYAAFAEDKLGSLSIGKKADFVVLDRDIMTVPVSQILETKVKATVIDGEVVYGHLWAGDTNETLTALALIPSCNRSCMWCSNPNRDIHVFWL